MQVSPCVPFTLFSQTGVKKKEGNVTRYILTDPAIHSVDETFGLTDCGATGMYKVLTGHNCNQICKQLQLEDTSV